MARKAPRVEPRHLARPPWTLPLLAIAASEAVVFFIWALGPHLMAFGLNNTAMILPQTPLRYVPLLNNARVPGRAIVVTYLALSALTAVAVAEWHANAKRGIPVVLVVAVAVIADYLPAPFPLISLNHPAVYDELRDRAEAGTVCELPLGLRDGFGQQGAFDDGVLYYQTIHQRPMVGGFVARLSRTVTDAYANDPLLAGLVSLSAREVDNAVALLASTKLRENVIRLVVLNRHRAASKLIGYVERVLPLTLVAEHDGRSLYIVSE